MASLPAEFEVWSEGRGGGNGRGDTGGCQLDSAGCRMHSQMWVRLAVLILMAAAARISMPGTITKSA